MLFRSIAAASVVGAAVASAGDEEVGSAVTGSVVPATTSGEVAVDAEALVAADTGMSATQSLQM